MSSDKTEKLEDEFSSDNLHKNLARPPLQRCREEPPDSDSETSSKPRGSSAPSKPKHLRTSKISLDKDINYTIESTDLYPKIKSDEQESSTSSPEKKPEKHSEGTPPKKFPNRVKVDGETSRTSGWGYSHFGMTFLCVVLGYLLGHYISSWSTNTSLECPDVPLFDVDAVVSTLKETFSALDEKNFSVLNASLRSISNYNKPKAPAVLLLASLEGNEHDSIKFSRHLAKTLSGNYISFTGNELRKIPDPKKHIDDTIKEHIEKNKINVFLISQLELINFKTMLIFHSFCDDQNAPYKRAVFVLTVSCTELDPSWKWDQVGEECLKQHWGNEDKDMIAPLITRLTPSVLILRDS